MRALRHPYAALLLGPESLYRDRRDAGRVLAVGLEAERGGDTAVIGLARGGVVVADEVARVLGADLDALAVRKVKHPLQPEYALGAVAPGGTAYIRGTDGLTPAQLATAVQGAERAAAELDARLHERHAPLDVRGRTAVLVDDGLATGATMIAALRWARAHGARRLIAAVPVAAAASGAAVREEADLLVCPREVPELGAVGMWYHRFEQVADEDVVALLAASDRTTAPAGAA